MKSPPEVVPFPKPQQPPVRDMRMEIARAAGQKGDLLMAQNVLASILAQDRNHVEALKDFSNLFSVTNRFEAAIIASKRAVALAPNDHTAWHNLAVWNLHIGKYEEAKAAALRSLAITDHMLGYRILGTICYSLGETKQALAAFERAICFEKDDLDLNDLYTLTQLKDGQYREGFLNNKKRWQFAAAHPFMHAPTPEWWGEPFEGRHIVVLHEQGYGDSLQFIRFAPWLKSKFGAGKVSYSSRDPLADLIRISGLVDEVCGIYDVGELGADFKTPVLTLPAFMELTPQNIPGEPYLIAPKRKPILPQDGKYKVGLCWGGIPTYAEDRWRSLHPFEYFPLIEAHPEISFYALQADDRSKQLWECGLCAFVTDLKSMLTDWTVTAAIVNELDLIVSVDTAVAHLAGAMGKPVWMTLPRASCWRWLDHASTTTPWYSSARLFRQQQQGEWRPVIEAISQGL